MSNETLITVDQIISLDPNPVTNSASNSTTTSTSDSTETIIELPDLSVENSDTRTRKCCSVGSATSSETSEWSEKEADRNEIIFEQDHKWVLSLRDRRNKFNQNLTKHQKVHEIEKPLAIKVLIFTIKFCTIAILLYFLIISIDLIQLAMPLFGGNLATRIMKNGKILRNPIVCMMSGILVSILIQNPVISISLITTIVSNEVITGRLGIFMIMGVNMGYPFILHLTTLAHLNRPAEFAKIFESISTLDMFTWLTSITLLVIECLSGLIYYTSKALAQALQSNDNNYNLPLVKYLTRPFISLILELDIEVLHCLLQDNCPDEIDYSFSNILPLSKGFCSKGNSTIGINAILHNSEGQVVYENAEEIIQEMPIRCTFLMAQLNLDDFTIGIIILALALPTFYLCLHLLKSILKLKSSESKRSNEILTHFGPFALVIGLLGTFVIQSCVTFLTILTPLVVLGVIPSSIFYPLALGSFLSNLFSSIVAQGDDFEIEKSTLYLQMSIGHLMYNLIGLLLFYPIPFTRIPTILGKKLSKCASKYRWFPMAHIAFLYFLLPITIIGLSQAGNGFLITFVTILFLLLLFSTIVNMLQKCKPEVLPQILKNWKWLPKPCKSLKPYDDLLSCKKICK